MKYYTLSFIGTTLIVIIGLVLIVAIFCIGIFNGLVGLRNRVKNAYAQIDVQLKRRYDLIPNLVETAKGYMKHEAGTLEAVTAARNQALAAAKAVGLDPTDGNAMKALSGAEGSLAGALGSLYLEQEQSLTKRTELAQSIKASAVTEDRQGGKLSKKDRRDREKIKRLLSGP